MLKLPNKKVAVIGSGIGGLAIAAKLAAKGYSVTLFEKNGNPGGKISEIKEKGYRFDTGPSLFTLPTLATEVAPFEYVELENSCRYFYSDGTIFNFYTNLEKLKGEIESKGIYEFENIQKRLDNSREIYDLTSNLFIFNDFHKLSNFVKEENRKIPLKLHKLGFHRSMHAANKSLFKDYRIAQLFDRYATYNGSSPYRAPATLNIISHLEHNIGAFFPTKGIYSIVDSFYKKCLELGVEFRFNSLVTKLEIDKKKKIATGIFVGSEFTPFDIIVSNCDAKYFAENMLPENKKHPLLNRLKQLEPSSSALIFYWGIKGEFPEFDLHNIFFSNNYKEEFNYLFHKMDLYDHPTVYLFISKKIVPDDAPTGCENWFVMVNAPANIGQDWSQIISRTRALIIERLNSTINEGRRLLEDGVTGTNATIDIEKLIETEHIASPVTIERNTLSSRGSLYGSSSNSAMSAFLRHPNSLGSINNLWFTGGSVHPGGGIPLCIASASIVEKDIIEKYNDKDA